MIRAAAEQESVSFKVSEPHSRFQVDDAPPDMVLNLRYGPLPPVPLDQVIFAPGGRWGLYRNGRQFFLAMDTPQQPKRLAIADQSFSRVEVFLQPSAENQGRDHINIDPFEYPLDEVLFVNFLAREKGVIIHSCGVDDGGRGVLFVGSSGAGKSTTARIWQKTDVSILSDDRIIVRRMGGRFRMYGTPWHGDANASCQGSAPLERLYFLQHASQNYVRDVTAADATARLLVRCFPPFYDRAGMAFTLELLAQIAAEVPCYELGFVPDQSIVDFVRMQR